MKDYILLMHDDCAAEVPDELWSSYFAKLRSLGVFEGGSAIGPGEVFRQVGAPGPASDHLSGYIRVRAETLADAKALLIGNPVYECGGSVQIRALPVT
jgi:hypothetical protein